MRAQVHNVEDIFSNKSEAAVGMHYVPNEDKNEGDFVQPRMAEKIETIRPHGKTHVIVNGKHRFDRGGKIILAV